MVAPLQGMVQLEPKLQPRFSNKVWPLAMPELAWPSVHGATWVPLPEPVAAQSTYLALPVGGGGTGGGGGGVVLQPKVMKPLFEAVLSLVPGQAPVVKA